MNTVFDMQRQSILSEAFDVLTVGMENWKFPIENVSIFSEDFDIMNEACIHFTGSELRIMSRKDEYVTVSADGYYLTIGA
jgi:hypothetical protein